MIPCTIFVWFCSFSSTSYVTPIVLHNAKKVNHSNTHIESKNQNTKRMEIENIPYFIFELKNPWMLILWRRLVQWVKIAANLASYILVVIFVVA